MGAVPAGLAVTAYDPEPWHDLFVMAGGAAAALAGLLFVAVSLNLDEVLKTRALPTLAGQSVALLIGLVVLSVFVLAPGQSRVALGIEALVLGGTLLVVTTVPTVRIMAELERRAWKAQRIAIGVATTMPAAVGGLSLILGAGGGLWWLLAAVILLFAVSTYNAWILLIEIRR